MSRLLEDLKTVSTATITTVLLKKGIRHVWMDGPRPLSAATQPRVVGPAFTLRFIPTREDVATPESWASPRSMRVAIEDMPPGCVAVVGALGMTAAGTIGDILCKRMFERGVAALVSDGAVRDRVGIERTGLPVWSNGVAAPPSITGLFFAGWQEPIGCGGAAVFPGDIVVADGDGAVVIPSALASEVAAAAAEQERMEEWIMAEVERGAALPGLYPPNAETRARYETWVKGRS